VLTRLLPPALLAALAFAAPAVASSAHCTVPTSSLAAWQSLHESGIGCHSARQLMIDYYKHGRITGWSCSNRISGRHVSFSCFNSAHHNQTLAGSWTVH